ncbi:MAG: MFS transporter [Alistipes sp.]|nr:MFS transporter [Alistipes sp.]
MSEITHPRDKLWTRNYIFIGIAAFMMAFSFFLLVPTLPFYLRQTFGIGHTMVGFVLSCYVVAVLSIRPFAGFIADSYPRKKVYIAAYTLFALSFIGYFGITDILWMFIALRIFHGFAFGTLSTTGNTLVIDVMPSSRRGEGLGYYGVTGNLAMAFGPMTGLFIIASGSYTLLFATSLTTACTGLLFASLVRPAPRPALPDSRPRPSADRFFMKEGLPACTSLFLLSIPYGMTTSYMALYAAESGIVASSGLFFTVMAAGLIISRLSSGKRVDRGLVTQTIRTGIVIALFGVMCEALLATVAAADLTAGYVVYFASAFLIGYGFGTMFPAFNTLFINLAPNSRRATANATYLTGWDVGIGCGMLLGGALSDHSFATCFTVGTLLVAASLAWFVARVTPHFQKHRVR